MEETDFDLVNASGKGDRQAFERLVKRRRNAVFNFIYRYLGDRQTAEDLVQEVFLRLYQFAPRFEARAQVSTWLFKVAYNLSMNELKRRKRRMNLHQAFPSSGEVSTGEPSTDAIETKELEREVMAALDYLPENQKAAMLLRVNEELSYEEISKVLSISVAGVESLIFRARTRLKQLLKRKW
jgi:RNA polymerase sigma-70 factor (ECF subfamily)